jgi:teichoic acid transport system ATP-binding protein
MSNVAIEVNNISKMYKMYHREKRDLKRIFNSKNDYEEFYALKNVSFKINKGESVGIVGHNGAGKSTLLKILTGVAFPSCGTVKVDGRIASLLELGSGFNPELTGIENIYFNGSLNGLTTEEIEKSIPYIIEFADIGDFINRPVKSYSSGMFARLAFATAINVNPDILIVDEILSVGDIGFQVKCMGKFEEFKKQGKTIIYVSHGLGTVKKFCDRAIWLQHGEVVEDGNSVIVVEKYYNLNFNFLNYESLDEKGENEVLKDVNVESTDNDCIDYGADLKLDLNYNNLKENIKEPSISLEIRKTDGEIDKGRLYDQFVTAFSTNDMGFTPSLNKGINKINLTIKDIRLMAGNYYMDFVLYSGEKEIYRKFNVYKFIVKDKYRGEGFIILKHTWKD